MYAVLVACCSVWSEWLIVVDAGGRDIVIVVFV